MLSILSAKIPSRRPLFRFAYCFSSTCWFAILVSYLSIAIVSVIINQVWSEIITYKTIMHCRQMSRIPTPNLPNLDEDFLHRHRANLNRWMRRRYLERIEYSTKEWFRPLLTPFRALVSQSTLTKLKDVTYSQWWIQHCWQVGALFLVWSFSSKLLEFTVYPDRFMKIDSFSDVVDFIKDGRLPIGIYTFKDESFEEFIEDDEWELGRILKPYTKITNAEGGKDVWESWILPLINNGSIVFVSDDAFCNYYYYKFLQR